MIAVVDSHLESLDICKQYRDLLMRMAHIQKDGITAQRQQRGFAPRARVTRLYSHLRTRDDSWIEQSTDLSIECPSETGCQERC